MQQTERHEHRGEWVAIDPATDRVVVGHEDFAGLHELLDRDRIVGVVIQRVPTEDDPILIGLG